LDLVDATETVVVHGIPKNAAIQIVAALNATVHHAALVTALEGLLMALSMGPLEVAAEYGPDAHPDEAVISAAHKARAALATATGEGG
jgi:hypothetical protein